MTAATPDRNSRSSNRPAEYTLVAMAHGLYRQSSVAANAGVPVLQNPGFEAHTADKPAGWIFPPVCEQAGYRLELSTDAFAGQHAAHVSASSAKAQSFANLMQGFRENALDGFRGRRIRFRAAVKTQNLADTTKPGLWLRVDRRSTDPSRPVFGDFDNMQDRPIRSADWQHFEIVADVADDAVSLTVGLLLSGNGDAWIDDCSLEVVDDDTPKTTRDLTAQTSSVRSSSATAGSQSTEKHFGRHGYGWRSASSESSVAHNCQTAAFSCWPFALRVPIGFCSRFLLLCRYPSRESSHHSLSGIIRQQTSLFAGSRQNGWGSNEN